MQVVDNRQNRVSKVFLILITIFGSITLFVQPLFSAPDEGTHFGIAYSIFHDGKTNNEFKQYRLPVDVASYRDGSFFSKYIVEKGDFKENRLALNLGLRKIQYLPQAVGMLIGEMIYPSYGVIMFFGRLLNLILYIVGMYFAIKKAKIAQWVMAIVALFPISIQQAASLSYDPFFFVAIFLAFSLITNLSIKKEPLTVKWYAYIVGSVMMLFLAKSSALAMGLYFMTLPMVLFGNNYFTQIIDKIWKLCDKYKKTVIMLGILVFLLFLKYEFRNYGGLLKGSQILLNTFTRPDIQQSLDPVLTSGVIGNFGWLNYRLPEWLVIIDFIFLTIMAISEKHVEVEKRMVVTGGIVYFLNIVLVSLIMYFEWTIVTLKLVGSLTVEGNQGRYYTPFLICLAPIGLVLQKYIKIEISESNKKIMYIGFSVFNFIYFIVLTLLYYYTSDAGINFLPRIGNLIKGIN
ncbi:MAG: DUF2142 domain-containing protein [Lactococcus sp.]|uniref:DUF2142 domain-containing protein n=1 Tax=Pseudolactococcus piscium MKFS47 TaxID=297352 RepID=A0A0D6E055_9LACT|nr:MULTISPECIES: DUF2142 domain-containing protein [Lactococcus]MBQ2635523.1 DUF2142 domain-containing protein [Methanobrevibacter sp.]MDN5403146.1 DUF2142 domain-containing protein [Lactococcus sp.]MDN5411642.1 DUF2142 domain-containing protein [Lactococcus sp.]MDN5461236.1 DUF2142 domain-containing protein [Lactococcus sp.]MDN5465258.1 DUF2142 domain-containing protein [Lactococcus sp.]